MSAVGLFWIRVDFRIENNPALSFATQNHDDVIALLDGRKDLGELLIQRPSFQEALVSTMVVEAAHKSLNEQSTWQNI